MCRVLLCLPTSAQTHPRAITHIHTHTAPCNNPSTYRHTCNNPHLHTNTPSHLYTINSIYHEYYDSNITGGASIKTNKLSPYAALTVSLSPSFFSFILPCTRTPAISLHPSLHQSLQPQMVKHCDQLKTSLRTEPVIAPAI